MPFKRRYEDLPIDSVCGRWLVLGPSFKTGVMRFQMCRCQCGTERPVLLYDLLNGKSVSCGVCWKQERPPTLRHGDARKGKAAAEFRIWCGIRKRCLNPRYKHFDRYGGRGITICDRWKDSYENFLVDMGRRPSESHSIDRYPDNDGNYEPSNCRWATRIEQSTNRHHIQKYTYDGHTLTIAEWSRLVGLPYWKLHGRLRKSHWPIEKALRF